MKWEIQSRKQNDTVKEEKNKETNKRKQKRIIIKKFKEHKTSGNVGEKEEQEIRTRIFLNVLPNVHCYDTSSIHYIQYYTNNLNKKFSTKRKSKKIG